MAGEDRIFDTEWFYEYDSVGNLTSQIAFQKSILWQKIIQKFDSRGNKISYENTFYEGAKAPWVLAKSLYVYNDKDQKIKEITCNSELIYEYDNKGNIIKKLVYSEGKIEQKEFTKYDEFGNEIENRTIFSRRDKELIENKYKYDINGNWIRKDVYFNKMPLEIIIREIEYY